MFLFNNIILPYGGGSGGGGVIVVIFFKNFNLNIFLTIMKY